MAKTEPSYPGQLTQAWEPRRGRHQQKDWTPLLQGLSAWVSASQTRHDAVPAHLLVPLTRSPARAREQLKGEVPCREGKLGCKTQETEEAQR